MSDSTPKSPLAAGPARRLAMHGIAVLLLVLLVRAGLGETLGGLIPRCPLHTFTGLYCPGCGATRASLALLAGDLPGALSKNLLFVVALLPLVWFYYQRVIRDVAVQTPRWALWTMLVVFVLFGVLRNLPWMPFTLLAPS